MARPKKQGLDYFPMDANVMRNVKIRRLKSKYGATGIWLYFLIVSDCYSEEGFYVDAGRNYKFMLAENMTMEEGEVDLIIAHCVELELFDKEMYEKYGVLTSVGIQKRYLEATMRRVNNKLFSSEYYLLENIKEGVSVDKNSSKVAESAQSKAKERKAEESKVEQSKAPQPSHNAPARDGMGCVGCESEVKIEVEEGFAFDRKRDEWKRELLADEEWRAAACRQSGMGTMFNDMLESKMIEYEDFIIAHSLKETVATKKDYCRRFNYWWRDHGKSKTPEQERRFAAGGKWRQQQQPKSRIQQLNESCDGALEIAMKYLNMQA